MKVDEEIIDQIRKQLGQIDAEPFFLCISGSDNYGFSSENNSDVDVRGAYYFTQPDDIFNDRNERSLTREGEYMFEGMKYEWQLHEISKFLRLFGKSNMNTLDWIFSNNWIVHPPVFFGMSLERFRAIAPKSIDQNMVNHALGWTKHMYNLSWRDPKKVLHSLRPLMTCVNYLERNEYEPNIQILVQKEPLTKYDNTIHQLIDLKKRGVPTGDHLKNKSLEAYEELVEHISSNRNKIPDRNEMTDQIKATITQIRLRTLREHGHI